MLSQFLHDGPVTGLDLKTKMPVEENYYSDQVYTVVSFFVYNKFKTISHPVVVIRVTLSVDLCACLTLSVVISEEFQVTFNWCIKLYFMSELFLC